MTRKNAIKKFWSLLDQIKDHFDLRQEEGQNANILLGKSQSFYFVLEEKRDIVGGIKGASHSVYCIINIDKEKKEVEFGLHKSFEEILKILS